MSDPLDIKLMLNRDYLIFKGFNGSQIKKIGYFTWSSGIFFLKTHAKIKLLTNLIPRKYKPLPTDCN